MKATFLQRLKKHREYKARERQRIEAKRAQENLEIVQELHGKALEPLPPMTKERAVRDFVAGVVPEMIVVHRKGKRIWA